MAKKTVTNKKKESKISIFSKTSNFFKNRQNQTIIGSFLILFSIFLTVAFISFFFSWKQDQSALTEFTNKAITTKNLLGKVGAKLSHFFIYDGFGLGAFIIPMLLAVTGFSWFVQSKVKRVIKSWNWGLLIMLWLSVTLGFLNSKYALLSGTIGFEVNEYLQTFLGKTGLAIILFFFLVAYLVIRFRVTPEKIAEKLKRPEKKVSEEVF